MTKRRQPPFPQAICRGCGDGFSKFGKRVFCSQRCRETNSDFAKKRAKYAADPEYRETIREKRRKYVEQFPEKARASDAKSRSRPENRVRAAAISREWHAENKPEANRRRAVRKQAQRCSEPWTVSVNAARARSKKKGIPFDLTDEWAKSRWTGACELTGIAFTIGLCGVGAKLFSPSIDKINPANGYTQDNCRFIIWCVNAFKYDGTDEQMYSVATALMKARPRRDDVVLAIVPSEAAE